jgi:uncharacterized protein (TIGR00730 family)
MTKDAPHKNTDHPIDSEYIRDLSEAQRMRRIDADFRRGFDILQGNNNTVTFFGSARFDENNEYYIAARELAGRLSQELDLGVVSGGGPGIMEAGNRGAHEVGGVSLGMTIQLPHEQTTNPYVTDTADFYYFFSRKMALAFGAQAFVIFPGGFGTLDEFFEIITLMQTNKIPKVPVILYGETFWEPLLEVVDQVLKLDFATIDPTDTSLYLLTDSLDLAVNVIASSES